jgi:hypothetical protein
MRQRGVRVVDGFDADEAAFQAELVRTVPALDEGKRDGEVEK